MQEHFKAIETYLSRIVTGETKDVFVEIQRSLNQAREFPARRSDAFLKIAALAVAGMEMTKQTVLPRGRAFVVHQSKVYASNSEVHSASRWGARQGFPCCDNSLRGLVMGSGLYFYNTPDGQATENAVELFLRDYLHKVIVALELRNPALPVYAGNASRSKLMGQLGQFYCWIAIQPKHDFLDTPPRDYTVPPEKVLVNVATGVQVWPT